jgi:hypothetical protein
MTKPRATGEVIQIVAKILKPADLFSPASEVELIDGEGLGVT